jgi:hypothetical protein
MSAYLDGLRLADTIKTLSLTNERDTVHMNQHAEREPYDESDSNR